jgi:hypothetical protein
MIQLAQAASVSPEPVSMPLPAGIYGLSALALIGLAMLVLGMGKMLKGLREFRAGVADEIRREIDAAAKTPRVDVQQPFTVRPYADSVLRSDYDRDQETNNDRHKAAKVSREKIHENLKSHEARITSLEKGERHTDAALATIDQKVTTILQRLPKNPS